MNAGYHTHDPVRSELSPWVVKFVLLGLVATIVTAFLLIDLGHESSVGPQQTFETHLAALDEQQWELADTFVVERCQTNGNEAREAAVQNLASQGYSFSRAFVVDEVWFNEDERTVLLGLATPANLPLPGVATMERVDGNWMVSCS